MVYLLRIGVGVVYGIGVSLIPVFSYMHSKYWAGNREQHF
jgi:hypothetical protein